MFSDPTMTSRLCIYELCWYMYTIYIDRYFDERHGKKYGLLNRQHIGQTYHELVRLSLIALSRQTRPGMCGRQERAAASSGWRAVRVSFGYNTERVVVSLCMYLYRLVRACASQLFRQCTGHHSTIGCTDTGIPVLRI